MIKINEEAINFEICSVCKHPIPIYVVSYNKYGEIICQSCLDKEEKAEKLPSFASTPAQ
jgi:recombinational DNA repair protein (RecF pathway)